MLTNVGTLDRWARILLGLALIETSLMGYVGGWGWIGIVPLATGLFSYCPAYQVFGFNTCSSAASKQ